MSAKYVSGIFQGSGKKYLPEISVSDNYWGNRKLGTHYAQVGHGWAAYVVKAKSK